MAKTIHKVVVTLCHKEILTSKIFKLLKGIIGCSGVYKTKKVSKRLVAADQKRCVRTKNLLKNQRKIITQSKKERQKPVQEVLVSRLTRQAAKKYFSG